MAHPDMLVIMASLVEDSKVKICTEAIRGSISVLHVEFSLLQKLDIALHVARALDFFHSSTPSLCFGNFGPEFVLVKKDDNIHI